MVLTRNGQQTKHPQEWAFFANEKRNYHFPVVMIFIPAMSTGSMASTERMSFVISLLFMIFLLIIASLYICIATQKKLHSFIISVFTLCDIDSMAI